MPRDRCFAIAINALVTLTAAPALSQDTYGTSAYSVYVATAADFQPIHGGSGTSYVIDLGGYLSVSSGFTGFLAPVHIPEGAIVDAIRLQNCDPSGSGIHLELDDYFGDHQTTFLAELFSTAKTGCADDAVAVSPSYQNVTNSGHHLLLTIGLTGPAGTDKFSRAEVFYRRSVSPPPGTADFNDVPTSHPFFQFVEALYQSGITAGCGGGNYCPNAPLTRGQMAVFLAKALGLHWPNPAPF